MRGHVELGEGIVRRIDEIAPAAPAVRHHHEHVDGSGYPDGLVGDAIPIEARVVAAADAYSAIAADRVYARGRDRDAALAELRESGGSHLDARGGRRARARRQATGAGDRATAARPSSSRCLTANRERPTAHHATSASASPAMRSLT